MLPEDYEIPEDDADLLAQCEVQVFRASGKGGQSVNTTDSAVRLKHRPSGLAVVCRRQRSQLQNKRECLARLRTRLEALQYEAPERRATRASAAAKRARLEDKVRRARVKRLRGPIDTDG